ncbi:MAG: hypothetical protein ACYDHP_09230 [Ferrimicrobium sp.]
MTTQTWIDLGAAVLLLTSVFIAAYTDLGAQARLIRVQGVALAAIPLILSIRDRSLSLAFAGVFVLVVRGFILPRSIVAAIGRLPTKSDDVQAQRGTTLSLLVSGLLTIVALVAATPLTEIYHSIPIQTASVGLAMVLIGVQVLLAKRRAVGQIIGFLMIDNGIDALGFLAALGVPLILEIGGTLDLVLVILILGVLTDRMIVKFGGTDVDELSELNDL